MRLACLGCALQEQILSGIQYALRGELDVTLRTGQKAYLSAGRRPKRLPGKLRNRLSFRFPAEEAALGVCSSPVLSGLRPTLSGT